MASNTNSTTGFHRSLSGGYLSIYYDGTEVQRFNSNGYLTTGTAAGRIFKAGSTTTPASTPVATTASGDSMFRVITGLDHDSTYGAYFRSYVRTAAISGDAFRAFNTVLDVAAGTARGAHVSLSFNASGTVTGLGCALEATLHVPSTAGMAGTVYAVKAAINSDAATSDPAGATTIAYFAAVNQGNATGGADVDTDAVLFHIDGHTISNGNLIEAVGTAYALSELTHSIRIKAGGTLYYIPISTTAASAT